MTRVLIVAHPDDECLWFAPEKYDRIVIVHKERKDNTLQGGHRANAIANHPLRERITWLQLTESNFWRDASQKEHHLSNYDALCKFLETLEADEVTTHAAHGEYSCNQDHIMCFNACMATLNCPVNGQDPKMFRAIKKAYTDAGCWTWY